MINVSINAEEFTKKIVESFSLNLKETYRDIGLIFMDAISQQFETEGRYFDSVGWKPLAPSTILERQRLGFFPINILRRRAGDAGLLGSINLSFDSDGVVIGTNVHYAKYLQEGTSKMPARPFFPTGSIPQVLMDDIAYIVSQNLLN